MPEFNQKDKDLWEGIFRDFPADSWKSASPSAAMKDCLHFFLESGSRTVLDVGCGPGRWSIYFAKHGLDVKGVDFSDEAIKIASSWAIEEGFDIDFRTQYVTQRPFPTTHFDAVAAPLILDNISSNEMRIAISHIRDALNPAGCVFALFNPLRDGDASVDGTDAENPTEGITQVAYKDSEILNAFKGFTLVKTGVYEAGMRGFFLRLGN